MATRIFQHIFFWLGFILLYAIVRMLFAGPSDLAYPPSARFLRFVFSELVFLPWKMFPFYVLFYLLIPFYFPKRQYAPLVLVFVCCLIGALLGYRSMIGPLSNFLYNEVPDFEVFSWKRLLFTLTDILPAIALASSAKLLKGRIATQKKLQALEREKQATELHFLKAQTNPHFLFNTLNNIYGIARKGDPPTAEAILKLAGIMRYILKECKQERISLEKELSLIQDYIALEKMRYDERLQLSFKQKGDIATIMIPPLILLPFVENAFKHGVSETRFEAQILIVLEVDAGKLLFKIENTYDPEVETSEEGIGLQNIKRQLELQFEDHYQLEIDQKEDVFSVQLLIQLAAYEYESKTKLLNH